MIELLRPLAPKVAPNDLFDAAAAFDVLEASAGYVLFEEGEPDDALVIVVEGRVAIRSDGFDIATIEPVGVLGEIGAFGGHVRMASAVTLTNTVLLVIERDAYNAMSKRGNGVAMALERLSLRQGVARYRATLDKLASVALPGELTPVVPNALPIKADLAKKLALGPFKGVAGEVVAVLARRAQPWFAPPAHRLPPGVHLILAGELDQQVGAPGTMATVTLGNGDAIGILAAVDGGPEPHVRVLENVTCARFEPAVAAALIEADDRVGSAFRSALLTALGNQTAYANARLTDLLRRRSG